MTNTTLLRAALDRSGYRLRYVSMQLGISYQAFVHKIKNESEFKASEIAKLSRILNLAPDERENIFFNSFVDETSTNVS